ncbi:MAG: MMPL family transporter [Pseudomonadota bacterium]
MLNRNQSGDLADGTQLSSMASIIGRLVGFVENRATIVVSVYGIALLASIYAATGLSVDTDSSKMLSPDLGFQAKALALREAFPDQKTAIVIVVRAANADAADSVTAKLAMAVSGKEGIASVFAPSVDPFFLTNGALYLETDELDQQLSRISGSSNLIAGLRSDQSLQGFVATLDQALSLAEGAGETADLAPVFAEAEAVFRAAAAGERRPFGWSTVFAGTSGPVLRTLTVQPVLDFTALNPAKPALASIRGVLAEFDMPPGVEVGITGDPVLRQEELRSVTAKIGWSLGLSLVFVAIVLWLALRTMGRVLLGLAALSTTLILTTGIAAVGVGSLNLISIAFIVLMVGLGIDFAIHFLAHLDEKATRDEKPLIAAAQSIGPALALTAGSTSLAFLAFTVTDFVGMAQLGLIGGAGVLIAFAVSITFIPAIVALRPGLALGAPRGRIPGGMAGRRAMPWIMVALGLGATVMASESRFDSDPMGLRDPNAPSVQTYNWLAEDPDRSPLRASVVAETAEEADELATAAKEIEGVRGASWLGSLLPDDQDTKLELVDLAWPSLEHAATGTPEALTETTAETPDDLTARLEAVPEGQGLAEALRLYQAAQDAGRDEVLNEDLFTYFPLLTDRLTAMLEMDYVEVETLPDALSRQFVSGGKYRVDILPEADIRLPENRAVFIEKLTTHFPGLTGGPAQIEGARIAVSHAMLQAVAIALLGAGVLSFATLRSVTGTLSILIPVALAGAVCMAAGVLLNLPFNYANVIVLPLMIGIGVDSGIHLAMRARKADQVFSTSTPMATFYSALTTIAAFGTLGLSDHQGTASMGILLAIGLSATVMMTFALTPGLARFAIKRS